MDIISKISKGTRMDQIYIPKNRHGFGIGSYVVITAVQTCQKEIGKTERLFFYHVSVLEPIKVKAIQEIFEIIGKHSSTYENIIITGSFLEKGFHFNDIDILLISDHEEDREGIKKAIEEQTGIKTQLIFITNKELLKGIAMDPLYEMMLSNCIAKKRFIYKTERKINYKLLDLQLLKSKTLMDNFDLLDGNEKWYLVRNLFSIFLFLENKKINQDYIEEEIKKQLRTTKEKIKKNMLEKKEFLKKYKRIYQKIFIQIMNSIKNDTK